jgi:hypothetical protein
MGYLGVIQEISVNKIRHSPYQFRMNLDNIDELDSSIKEHSLLQPIVVRFPLLCHDIRVYYRQLVLIIKRF